MINSKDIAKRITTTHHIPAADMEHLIYAVRSEVMRQFRADDDARYRDTAAMHAMKSLVYHAPGTVAGEVSKRAAAEEAFDYAEALVAERRKRDDK